VAITATCAEVGVLGGQRSCLDPVDGIGVGILGSDGSAALALADKRTLAAAVSMPYSASSSVLRLHRRRHRTYGGFGLVLARQFLHVGFLFGRHKGGVSHAERGGATVLVLVLVLLLASVLVVKGGRKDRGADW
jgi:hypothetical protein